MPNVGQSQLLNSRPQTPSVREDIGQRVKKRFKALAPLDFSVIDSRSKGISDGRKLEFFPADERDNPTPGRMAVEVFDPSFKGETLDNMIAADMLHHLGKKDPVLIKIRQRFRDSLSQEQRTVDRRVYDNEVLKGTEARSFDQWFEVSRLDQYIGSAFLPDGSKNKKDWLRGMSEDQKFMLDAIKTYMKEGRL